MRAVLGGAGGLVLAGVGVRLLAPLLPVVGSYTHPSPQIDYRVLAFTVVAVLLTTVLFGLLPAVRNSRTATLRVAASPGRWSAGRVLVVELALSVVLLAGTALLVQSLWNLQRVEPGFRTDRLLTMQVWLPESKYPTPASVRTFTDDVLQRVESLPGVRSASTVNRRPFLGWSLGLQVDVPGYIPPETMEEGGMLTYRFVSHRYFETLGAELAEGRTFSTADRPDGAVTVANEAAAARYWPGAEPVGRQLRPRFQPGAAPWIPEGRADWFTVVGGRARLPRASGRRIGRAGHLSLAGPEPFPSDELDREHAGARDRRRERRPGRDPDRGRRPRRLRPQDDGRHPLGRRGPAATQRAAGLVVRRPGSGAVGHRRPRRHVAPPRRCRPKPWADQLAAVVDSAHRRQRRRPLYRAVRCSDSTRSGAALSRSGGVQNRHTPITIGSAASGRYSSGSQRIPARRSTFSCRRVVKNSSV